MALVGGPEPRSSFLAQCKLIGIFGSNSPISRAEELTQVEG